MEQDEGTADLQLRAYPRSLAGQPEAVSFEPDPARASELLDRTPATPAMSLEA